MQDNKNKTQDSANTRINISFNIPFEFICLIVMAALIASGVRALYWPTYTLTHAQSTSIFDNLYIDEGTALVAFQGDNLPDVKPCTIAPNAVILQVSASKTDSDLYTAAYKIDQLGERAEYTPCKHDVFIATGELESTRNELRRLMEIDEPLQQGLQAILKAN